MFSLCHREKIPLEKVVGGLIGIHFFLRMYCSEITYVIAIKMIFQMNNFDHKTYGGKTSE